MTMYMQPGHKDGISIKVFIGKVHTFGHHFESCPQNYTKARCSVFYPTGVKMKVSLGREHVLVMS